jgi:UDP-N-acetylglucosamine--N-acetylmuramyl-(pentapeptide) pyrophosphoryl-undecaprenol N-acetylglucosamine transferase
VTTYLLAGGGTAGHVNPLLAVAAEIRHREPQATVIFLGTAEGLESRLVPAAGYEFEVIPRLPFPRRPDKRALRFLRGWRGAVSRVEQLIASRGVDVVFGVGGYVAAPAYAAARRAKVPLVIHEANARPGLSNAWAAGFATRVAVAIPGTRLRRSTWVGMPLRADIAALSVSDRRAAACRRWNLKANVPVLLVTGGSLGARRINLAIATLAPQILAAGWQILHITGDRDAGLVTSTQPGHVVIDYCDNMADALAAASLTVSRAGSSTLAEVTALGIPAILIPYASGNGEQELNAAPVVAAGGAVLVRDASVTADSLWDVLSPLLNDRDARVAMSAATSTVGTREGAARTVDLIGEALTQSLRSAS